MNARGSVLMCAKAYPPAVGGVESYSEFVARCYLAAGYTPTVISQWPGRRGWTTREYPEGPVRVLNLGLGPQLLVFAKMFFAAGRLCLTNRYSFLHPTTWRTALAVFPWRGKAPVVLTVYGRDVLANPPVLEPFMRAMLRRADIVVGISQASFDAGRKACGAHRPKGRWDFAFCGISYPKEAAHFVRPPKKDGPLVIYSFCRLVERKNIHTSLRAVKLLRNRGFENFRYVIAGSGPMKNELKALTAELGLEDRVQMLGYIDEADITKLYQQADIFLHPQTAPEDGRDLEGFGITIADAMSFGAVGIVGRDGGPREFVLDGKYGYVVDGNDVDAIADALEKLVSDPQRLEKFSEEGRAWCLANLSWTSHTRVILSLVEAIAKSGVPELSVRQN